MATSDWLPLVTAALGGLLAAGGGALVQWTSNRRADERAREDLRRTAYVGLLTATDALLPEIRRWPAAVPGRDQSDRSESGFDTTECAPPRS